MSRANDGSESLLSLYAATRGFRLGHPGWFRFTPDGDELLFLRSGPRDPACALHALGLATGRERVLVRAEDLLGERGEVVPAQEAARRERMRLLVGGITSYELSADGDSVLIPLSGRLFVVDRASGRSRELVPAGGAPVGPAFDPRLSPDGARAAAVRDGDLWVTELATGATRPLTRSTGAVTCGLAEFVAQEEMKRLHGYWWSPDGARLAFQRTDESMVEVLRISDPRHPERAPDERRYPRPGNANAEVTLGVIDVPRDVPGEVPGAAGDRAGGRGGDDAAVPEPVWVAWDRERWPYLVTVKWQPGAPLTIAVQNRAQTEIALLAADDRTGATRTLHLERDPAWVNIDQSMPLWLPDGAGLLWMTERAGAWQLELREPDGALRHAVTSREFGLQGVVGLDPAGWVYARATREPTVSHLWRVPLDPRDGQPAPLTHAPGVHTAAVSCDGRRFVHGASLPSGEELAIVRDSDGSELARVAATAEPLPLLPNMAVVSVQAPGEDGEARELYTGVIWPRDHRPGRKCPVIVHVYGGPHHNVVSAQPRRYLLNQWLADQGFAIVLADGRGTQHRGRAWERAIKGDLAGPALDDQVAALRALGAEHPDLDTGRVGISGWSFGGYLAAMAALRRPDVFRAAVAGAPVVDWRDYDTHYTERYLGLPDEAPDAYRTSNVLTYADRLTRPMLIIHGTVDDNVYFMHSLKLSDALLRAGAPHEFLPLSGFTHMVPGAQTIERLHERIARFFATHLGVAP